MQVTFGAVCPEGSLPLFSVDTEQEARDLLVATCSLGLDGEYYARELAPYAEEGADQTGRLDAFYAFGERLRDTYARIKLRRAERASS